MKFSSTVTLRLLLSGWVAALPAWPAAATEPEGTVQSQSQGQGQSGGGAEKSLTVIPPETVAATASPVSTRLRYNRDIRPILSENCFHCHGQDGAERKARLRLDTAEGALAGGKSGPALVPGRPGDSLLLQRMESQDPDRQMPPADSHRQVRPEQVDLVRRWIAEGAVFETHWAFTPPVAEPPPAVRRTAWAREPWDAWVLARLEQEGLAPAAEARPEAWLRRASFDLTGLAATPEETLNFVRAVTERGDGAYAAEVERLLASPRYGERMTAEWLDAARYADTHGFNNDTARSMWRWRDWVIGAFNQNLPYDQFITRQLAGDLLPEPSLDDRIATGFCRNHVINSEGGIIDEEYRVEYVADRVRTLGMTWMGLTMECARCHDHKYDPVSAKDYYRLYAFFNQVPEWGEDGRIANAVPLMPAPTAEQQEKLAELDRKIGEAEEKLAGDVQPADLKSLAQWLVSTIPDGPAAPEVPAPATGTPPAPVPEPPALVSALRDGKWINRTKPDKALPEGLEVREEAALGVVVRLPGEGKTETKKLETVHFPAQGHQPWTLMATVVWQGGEAPLLSGMAYDRPMSSTSHGEGMEIRINAAGQLELRVAAKWPVYGLQIKSLPVLTAGVPCQIAVVSTGQPQAAAFRLYLDGKECGVEVPYDGLSGNPGARPLLLGQTLESPPAVFRGELADLTVAGRVLEAADIRAWADRRFVRLLRALPAEKITGTPAVPEARLREVARRHRPETAEKAGKLAGLQARRLALMRSFPSTMVMRDLARARPTHVLMRGVYDAPGEAVEAGVPESLLGAWPPGAPKNRLGLAQWLTGKSHPLTGRVVVNRFWQQVFGTGLVKTVEDFGFQGEYPSHPELLDALARQFVESGWDVKALMRSVVLSATYRQDSRVSAELAARDPENRLLARGPRRRLPAEMIRDHALAVSGLLRERVGGPSVYPEQPPELYKGVVVDAPYPGSTWPLSQGDDLYRRSLYTFWKRTVPHPLMTVFDVPDRESGCVRRSLTNTPLQALAMMNEPSLLRAAGHLGGRMRREGGAGDTARLAFGFQLCTGRPPGEREAASLGRLLEALRKSYQADAEGARAMTASGGLPAEAATPPEETAETAAWTALASNLLNLDETITRG